MCTYHHPSEKTLWSSRGFTIVELLIVIVVIAVLAAISVVAFNGVQGRAHASQASAGVAQAKKKLEVYKVTNSETYPTTGNLGAAGVSNNDVTYQYTSDGATFCITGTAGATAYRASNTTSPNEGVCSGHTEPVSYTVGDTGPGGGVVFYDKGNTNGGWQYLEAAPGGWNGGAEPVLTWGCNGISLPGADGTAIGTGEQNTADILSGACSGASHAPNRARNYSGGGKTDWFLPSRDELVQLYAQRTIVGGFTTGYYWASSEMVSTDAYLVGFSSGSPTSGSKVSTYYVRPIRSF